MISFKWEHKQWEYNTIDKIPVDLYARNDKVLKRFSADKLCVLKFVFVQKVSLLSLIAISDSFFQSCKSIVQLFLLSKFHSPIYLNIIVHHLLVAFYLQIQIFSNCSGLSSHFFLFTIIILVSLSILT